MFAALGRFIRSLSSPHEVHGDAQVPCNVSMGMRVRRANGIIEDMGKQWEGKPVIFSQSALDAMEEV